MMRRRLVVANCGMVGSMAEVYRRHGQRIPGFFDGSARFGPMPLRCMCCGAVEQTEGCVLGFTCDCSSTLLHTDGICHRCRKCRAHCACSEGFLSWEAFRQEKGYA